MGIQAYQLAEPLDADGLYHMALIYNVVGQFTAARTAGCVVDLLRATAGVRPVLSRSAG